MKYSEPANLDLLERAKPTGNPLVSGRVGVGFNTINLGMKNKRITVLVVDDHPIVRDGLTAAVNNQPDMFVVAEASDGIAAVVKYREHRPDVVVMDLRMPGLGGVGAILQIRREFPGARIIVLTTYEGDEDIHRALEAGARAYLLKDMVRTELLHTIREVIEGQRHLSAGVAERLKEYPSRSSLSDRELQVLNLVAKGLRNKEIGAALEIAEDTVKIHVKNIFGKLDVIDRTQAVVTASQRGFIRLERNE
jgi:two-component system NarL family response regulator